MLQVIESDWSAYFKIILNPNESFSDFTIYQACSAVANGNKKLKLEEKLKRAAKKLLEVRRLINQSKLHKAYEIIRDLKPSVIDPLLQGDRYFLKGMIERHLGDSINCHKSFRKAREFFTKNGQDHRLLRSLMNEKIILQNIESFENGPLFAIAQQATQKGYYDISGNIYKAYSVELIEAGDFLKAKNTSLKAVADLSKDGSPNDLSVSYALCAISSFLLGERNESKKYISHVGKRNIKLNYYLEVYDLLKQEKIPILNPVHPLYKTKWPRSVIKSNSIRYRVLEAIRSGKLTKDEIIFEVWGKAAKSQSYVDRLHSIIKSLRKENELNIYYDGFKYKLVEKSKF